MLIIAVCLLVIFLAIALAVPTGILHTIDSALLLGLRTGSGDNPIGPRWVETMFLDITSLGSNTIVALVTLAAAGFLLVAGKRSTALLVLAAILGGTILNNLLKFGFGRARPDLVAHAVEVQTLSFPSGHAMLSAVAYLTLGALLTQTQSDRRNKLYILALALAVTAMIGISRVYLGVHWPTDVLAGWIGGGAWALICWDVARRLQRRGHIEQKD